LRLECLKGDERNYSDEEITIYPIPLADLPGNNDSKYFCSTNRNIQSINITPSLVSPSLCYACHLRDINGKFYPEKAKALGVKRGPLFADLSNGITITLEDGTQVRPEQVMDPKEPGPIILIIDCPSDDHMTKLLENVDLSKYHENTSTTDNQTAHLVFHLTPLKICEHENYKTLIKKFPTATQHIFLNNLSQESQTFYSQHGFQVILNSINDRLFPLLSDDVNKPGNKLKLEDPNVLKNFCKMNLRNLITKPDSVIESTGCRDKKPLQEKLKQVLFNEKLKDNENESSSNKEYLENSIYPISNTDKDINNVSENKDITNPNNILKRKLSNSLDQNYSKKLCSTKSDNEIDDSEYPKIICLGTGASLPSKLRNVSATLVFLNCDTAVLLDCGEGTYGQLCRHYGNDKVNTILEKVKLVLVSHMHADHHLGLISLLKKFDELNKRPDDTMIVIGPYLLLQWLKDYATTSEKLKFKFIDCRDCRTPLQVKFDLMVESVAVNHPGQASGFVIQHDDIKITYSGDTTPCRNLITAGMNSTVLIHEATIEDDLPEEAAARKHSTTSQALDVALKMQAKHVILTHISQRYPRMPIIKDTVLAAHTVFAFDHMEIRLKDMPNFHRILPTLTKLLVETDDDVAVSKM